MKTGAALRSSNLPFLHTTLWNKLSGGVEFPLLRPVLAERALLWSEAAKLHRF